MKVMVLEEALADLADGYRFYERQSERWGMYGPPAARKTALPRRVRPSDFLLF